MSGLKFLLNIALVQSRTDEKEFTGLKWIGAVSSSLSTALIPNIKKTTPTYAAVANI